LALYPKGPSDESAYFLEGFPRLIGLWLSVSNGFTTAQQKQMQGRGGRSKVKFDKFPWHGAMQSSGLFTIIQRVVSEISQAALSRDVVCIFKHNHIRTKIQSHKRLQYTKTGPNLIQLPQIYPINQQGRQTWRSGATCNRIESITPSRWLANRGTPYGAGPGPTTWAPSAWNWLPPPSHQKLQDQIWTNLH
jgi:hypothetical protein